MGHDDRARSEVDERHDTGVLITPIAIKPPSSDNLRIAQPPMCRTLQASNSRAGCSSHGLGS
jgi:hypothetical protein